MKQIAITIVSDELKDGSVTFRPELNEVAFYSNTIKLSYKGYFDNFLQYALHFDFCNFSFFDGISHLVINVNDNVIVKVF